MTSALTVASRACPTGQGLKIFVEDEVLGGGNISDGMEMSLPDCHTGRICQNMVGLLQLLAGISWLEIPIALGCSAGRTSLAVQHLR